MKSNNLFENLPDELPDELVEVLAEGQGSLRIERIVSRGHASPEGFWYDQESAEWVLLLQGSARLRFEGETEAVELRVGDWLEIAPHRRHRVEATSADETTLWLAVHWR
jgi:cupin 2 domain-containing protein